MIVKEVNGTFEIGHSITSMKRAHSNTSFPRDITEEILNFYGYFTVVINTVPPVQGKKIIQGPITKVLGVPTITQSYVDLTQEEIIAITVPKVVTMRQARLALLQAGLLATVEQAITNGTDESMKIEWEYATEVRRNWDSLVVLMESLGATSAELDSLFKSASTL